jgi:DNA-binding NarL/FixJ family response regulator
MSRPLFRVLIADRHHVVRRGVRLLVEDLDQFHVVAESDNGRDALQLAVETRPHVAIAGISLPYLNGAELAHQIGRCCSSTQVLIYSDRNSEKTIIEALRAGAQGYLLKSEPAAHLAAAIQTLAAQRTYFSQAVAEVMLKRLLRSNTDIDDDLTHREREVVQLIAEGRINKQIGHDLDISVKTVETHRAKAMHKLNLRTTADLVRYAIRTEIVQA